MTLWAPLISSQTEWNLVELQIGPKNTWNSSSYSNNANCQHFLSASVTNLIFLDATLQKVGVVCPPWQSVLSENGPLSCHIFTPSSLIFLCGLWVKQYVFPSFLSHPSSKVFFKGIYFTVSWQPWHHNWPESFHLTLLRFSVVMCVN